MKILAFDYGASSGRGMLGTYDGEKIGLEEIHRFSNDPVSVHGTMYWDVLRLFHEMKQGILKSGKAYGKDIASIGIDTWGVDFGLLDQAGQLLGNPVHYRDERTEGMIEAASEKVGHRNIFNETGTAFQKFNTLYQLLAMSMKKPELLERAKALLFMPDLLGYFLTGEKATEFTIASTAQMLDASTGDWAYGLLDKLGINSSILQKVINPGERLGNLTTSVSSELSVGNIPVISVAGHDTASAVMAVPATEGRYAYLSSGTWSLLGVELDKPIINDKTYSLNYTNEGGFNRATRLLKNIMGLWIYQECKRTWDKEGDAQTFDELEAEAENAMPFKCLIDPDDDVFYSPGKMPQKVVEYCKRTGQTLPETKAEIVRCVMESLALKYRFALEGLEDIVGYKIPVLNIVGGGSKNIMLCKFAANAIGRPVVTGPIEATALGNLLCQLISLGELRNISEARELIKRSFPVVNYLPQEQEIWNEAYMKFCKLPKI